MTGSLHYKTDSPVNHFCMCPVVLTTKQNGNGISLTLHGLLIVIESLQLTGSWGEQVNVRLKWICFEFN